MVAHVAMAQTRYGAQLVLISGLLTPGWWLQALTEDELRRVLTEPKSALVKQFRTQLAMSDAELHITTGALRNIAETAVHKGTGARGLRTILEDLLHQAQFEVRPGVRVVAI